MQRRRAGVEQQLQRGRRALPQVVRQRLRLTDQRRRRAALLRCLAGNALPARPHARQRRGRRPSLGARRDYRHDGGRSQLGSLADDPVHQRAPGQRLDQRQPAPGGRPAAGRRRRAADGEAQRALRDLRHGGPVARAGRVHHGERGAGGQPPHPYQVVKVGAGHLHLGAGPRRRQQELAHPSTRRARGAAAGAERRHGRPFIQEIQEAAAAGSRRCCAARAGTSPCCRRRTASCSTRS